MFRYTNKMEAQKEYRERFVQSVEKGYYLSEFQQEKIVLHPYNFMFLL